MRDGSPGGRRNCRPSFSCPRIRPVVATHGRHTIAGGWAGFDRIDLVQRDDAGAYTACRMDVTG